MENETGDGFGMDRVNDPNPGGHQGNQNVETGYGLGMDFVVKKPGRLSRYLVLVTALVCLEWNGE